jgi:ribosomal protein S18 acetylase RimI-like enzyme
MITFQNPLPIIKVRPVQPSDDKSLKNACWSQRSESSIAELIQRTQKLAFSRRGLGAVGTFNGVLCGFGLLTLWPRAAEISDLFVSQQCRSQGVGSAIIAYLTTAARKLHATTLEIGVALSNPRALALYRRLGFIDGHIVEIVLDREPEPVLYLYKQL